MSTDRERLAADSETPDSRSENPVWRLYTEYGTGRRYAVMGAVATILGRAFGLVPAFVIGLAVDAIFLAERPYALPLVPDELVPGTDVEQLYFSIAILLGRPPPVRSPRGSKTGVERLRPAGPAQPPSRRLREPAGSRTRLLHRPPHRRPDERPQQRRQRPRNVLRRRTERDAVDPRDRVRHRTDPRRIKPPADGSYPVTDPGTRRVHAAFHSADRTAVPLDPRGDRGSELTAGEQRQRHRGHQERGAERFETERVAEASDAYLTTNLSAIKVRITYFPGLNVISGIGFAVTFLVGGLWVLGRPVFGLTGALTPGAFVTFVIYAQQFLWPIIRLGDVVDDYERAKAAGSRVQGVLSREPAVRDRPDAAPLAVDEGAVTYDDVQFGYAGGTVLTDVDFTVEGDDRRGSRPDRCRQVDAVEAATAPVRRRRRCRADRRTGRPRRDAPEPSAFDRVRQPRAVPLFGTVAENIRYGTFDATDDDIERAARRAQAHEFIENLPDGYDTLVGERGVRLSGGQRQRLALARTMLKDPAILVLDEATSAVDTETEALIQSRLAEFAADRTTFVIAHRLSTVRTADRILVLDDGQVVEDGTHEGLLETDGLYANFWRVQTGDIASLPREFLERALRRQAVIDLDDRAGDDDR